MKTDANVEIFGLHNHISSLSSEEKIHFLDECLTNKANVVSITDHRTLSSYYKLFMSLSEEQIQKYRNIRFVIGMELTGVFPFIDCQNNKRNIVMDILCYNIDIEKYYKLWHFIESHYTDYMNTREFQVSELQRLIKIAKQQGFKADYDKLTINDENPFAANTLSYALIDSKYVDYNLSMGLLPEFVTNPRTFFNRYCKADTPFYLDLSPFFPPIQEVINAIIECGALPFLDHPAAYFPKSQDKIDNRIAWLNSRKFVIDFFQNTKGVKGLEIIHPSFLREKDYYQFLENYSRVFHLYVSGGTDYHKNGERITTDLFGHNITSERLYNFEEWAKIYTIEELKNIVEMINTVEGLDKKKKNSK